MKARIAKKKDWRQFELLISKLEKVLKPSDCILKSPDWVLDNDINELREVDCSIRFPDGRIISVECRKRGSKQDVTWIEQLVAKKAALGLVETIAVSSMGFSKASYLKASKHNISLNTYREIDVNDVAEALKLGLLINQIQRKWAIHQTDFEITDDSPGISDQELIGFQNNLAANIGNAVILSATENSDKMTLSQVMELCLSDQSHFEEGKNEKTFKMNFVPGKITVPGFRPNIFITSLIIKADVYVTKKMIENYKMGKYDNKSGTLLQMASGTFETGTGEKRNLEILFSSDNKIPDPNAARAL